MRLRRKHHLPFKWKSSLRLFRWCASQTVVNVARYAGHIQRQLTIFTSGSWNLLCQWGQRQCCVVRRCTTYYRPTWRRVWGNGTTHYLIPPRRVYTLHNVALVTYIIIEWSFALFEYLSGTTRISSYCYVRIYFVITFAKIYNSQLDTISFRG